MWASDGGHFPRSATANSRSQSAILALASPALCLVAQHSHPSWCALLGKGSDWISPTQMRLRSLSNLAGPARDKMVAVAGCRRLSRLRTFQKKAAFLYRATEARLCCSKESVMHGTTPTRFEGRSSIGPSEYRKPMRKTEKKVIDIASVFTRFPAGRYREDGPFSGERFRDDLLIPALEEHEKVSVNLDGTMGYGSSFLEEVFGGLLRKPAFAAQDLNARIELCSKDRSLISEIREYLTAPRR